MTGPAPLSCASCGSGAGFPARPRMIRCVSKTDLDAPPTDVPLLLVGCIDCGAVICALPSTTLPEHLSERTTEPPKGPTPSESLEQHRAFYACQLVLFEKLQQAIENVD